MQEMTKCPSRNKADDLRLSKSDMRTGCSTARLWVAENAPPLLNRAGAYMVVPTRKRVWHGTEVSMQAPRKAKCDWIEHREDWTEGILMVPATQLLLLQLLNVAFRLQIMKKWHRMKS